MTIQENTSLAFQLFEEQKLKESVKMYEKIFESVLTNEEEIKVRFGYGYPLSALGHETKAIENYSKLKELGEVTNNREVISQSLHQIGMVYRQSKHYQKALEKFNEEREMIETYFRNHNLFKAANDYELGYTNLLLKNYSEALKYLEKSLKESIKSKDSIMIACAYRGLGEYYSSQSNIDLAETYFNKSIHSFKDASDEIGIEEVKELKMSLRR